MNGGGGGGGISSAGVWVSEDLRSLHAAAHVCCLVPRSRAAHIFLVACVLLWFESSGYPMIP
jgi:hypothetical protein